MIRRRVTFYGVDSDGHSVPVYSRLVAAESRRRRVVLPAEWVECVGVGLLVVALFCLPDLLLWLFSVLFGGGA